MDGDVGDRAGVFADLSLFVGWGEGPGGGTRWGWVNVRAGTGMIHRVAREVKLAGIESKGRGYTSSVMLPVLAEAACAV